MRSVPEVFAGVAKQHAATLALQGGQWFFDFFWMKRYARFLSALKRCVATCCL